MSLYIYLILQMYQNKYNLWMQKITKISQILREIKKYLKCFCDLFFFFWTLGQSSEELNFFKSNIQLMELIRQILFQKVIRSFSKSLPNSQMCKKCSYYKLFFKLIFVSSIELWYRFLGKFRVWKMLNSNIRSTAI